MTQPIQAVQIYYEHPFGAEREVLREFFSFVGCLVKTTMMPVETILEKHKSLVNPGSERITHLFLTDRLPEGIVLSKNEIWCSFRILKRELAINGKEILHNADQKISAEQFEKTTLDVIIRRIWKDDEAATQSLLHINASFWQLDLFEFLQIKSTFQALKMGELIALAKNTAIVFAKMPILEKCCDIEHYGKAKSYHQGSITVRAVLTVLRDMAGDSKINRDIINLVFTYRKSVIDWYVRAENKQYIKKNGHKIIEERTKEAKTILDKMYANYPNAILLEPSSPPVQELQRFEIIYPALGVSIYDGSVPRQYFYLHIWAKEIVNESRKQKRNTKTKLQHLSKQE